jgi:hypothetical protein
VLLEIGAAPRRPALTLFRFCFSIARSEGRGMLDRARQRIHLQNTKESTYAAENRIDLLWVGVLRRFDAMVGFASGV